MNASLKSPFKRLALLLGVLSLTASCAPTTTTTTTSSPAATTAASPAASPEAASAPAISTDGDVIIASSLPMTGSSLGQTQTIVNSIQLALDEVNSKVCDGKLTVGFQTYDDATAAAGKWDPAQVTSNSNKIAADNKIVAVIGTFNSGAAKLAIPIFNPVNLVMVSPANTYPGLTKPGTGEKNEPDTYYPGGKRNYARVVPADDLQGAAAANWSKALGVQKVYILDDQELYGKGIADVYNKTAQAIGLEVLGQEGINPKASDYRALMNKIKDLGPDMIYFGGITQNNAGQLIKDMRNVGMTDVKFMGPDGINEQALIDAAGKDAEGVYATFGGIPPKELTGKGKEWYDAYKAKFNSEPEPYAAYGYEAAQVVLQAIGKVCEGDREKIREAVMSTQEFPGLLGNWSFDENGDTTSTKMSGSVVKDGKWEFAETLDAK
ncbi:MAG: branched-chain amino acid ABC transporter substrate-binding protein [Elainella sp.]